MKKYFSNVENLNWWKAGQLSVNKCGNLYTVLYKKMKDYSKDWMNEYNIERVWGSKSSQSLKELFIDIECENHAKDMILKRCISVVCSCSRVPKLTATRIMTNRNMVELQTGLLLNPCTIQQLLQNKALTTVEEQFSSYHTVHFCQLNFRHLDMLCNYSQQASQIQGYLQKLTIKRHSRIKFPHRPILHYACGSMYVVLCFPTKKQQKQRIVPQLLHCSCHSFSCMHNEVFSCAEIEPIYLL